jgi:hypothetical protein
MPAAADECLQSLAGEIHEVWAALQDSEGMGYNLNCQIKDDQIFQQTVDLEEWDEGYFGFTKQRCALDDNWVRHQYRHSGGSKGEPLKARQRSQIELAVRGQWE